MLEPGRETANGCYQPSACGLVLSLETARIIFTDRLKSDHLSYAPDSVSTDLVLGTTWRTAWSDLMLLGSGGFNEIFCSKIIQPPLSHDYLARQAVAPPTPSNIYDLSSRGGVSFFR